MPNIGNVNSTNVRSHVCIRTCCLSMPELPEVEEARRTVDEYCVGRTIVAVTVADDDKVIQGILPSDLALALNGRKVISSNRKGKHLWFEFDQRPWLLLHLGMTGAIVVQGSKSVQYRRSKAADDEEWPPNYHKLLLEFEGGVQFAFVDSRRFARIRLQHNPPAEEPVSSLGPDAYLELPEPALLASALQKKSRPLKAVLLDQSFLSGIGNWIADEVLYQAAIHPEHPSQSLTDEECGRLHRSIVEVLALAVSVRADSALFPTEWLFHKRWSKKAGEMNGHRIQFITVGGRTSAFVPHIQKLPAKTVVTRRKTKKIVVGEGDGGHAEMAMDIGEEEFQFPAEEKTIPATDDYLDLKFGKTGKRSKKGCSEQIVTSGEVGKMADITGQVVVDQSKWVRRSARFVKTSTNLAAMGRSSVSRAVRGRANTPGT